MAFFFFRAPRLLRLLPFLLGLPPGLFSQTYTTLKSTTAKARAAFDDGRVYVQQGDVAGALRAFGKALDADPNFIDAHIFGAGAHYESEHWAEAEAGFEKAIALDAAYEPRALFTCAMAEWRQDKFTEAAQHAEDFLQSGPKNEILRRDAARLAENARFAAEAVLHPVPFNPQPVGEGVNSSAEEYLPALTADGQTMIFTRQEHRDENFYTSTRLPDGSWGLARPLDGVNTYLNEGAEAISADGSWLVFTACNRHDDGSQGNCDLYWSQFKNSAWTKPQPFSNAINSSAWDAQPSISPDGKTLFFSSDRPGTLGGKDLWYTNRMPGGKWSPPQNLGPGINTPGDEQTPFLHPDGQTLYFTSDGLPGMGGNDLYVVRKKRDGAWDVPQNLGYPINTKASEGTLTVSLDGKTAYFAANRPAGKGGIDIYTFDMPAAARPQPVTYARALVTDAVTGYPITAKVEFTDLRSGQVFASANTKSDGTFLVCLPAGKDYALNVSKSQYLFFSENFNLEESASFDKPFELNIELQPIASTTPGEIPAAPSKPIALRNVFFETGSAALKSESTAELDRLVALLNEAAALHIQINGHTDNTGDDITNLGLSENRAKAVYDYLIAKGIKAERLKYKGFGESQPLETNDTADGRAKNRRTEFVVQ